MTTMIKQRNSHDCVLACMAMALGVPYEEVDTRLKVCNPEAHDQVHTHGTQDSVYEMILAAFGYLKDRDYWRLHFAHNWANMSFCKNFIRGRRAIMTVRSKNFAEGFHAVFWDGHQLFDPSPLDTYEDLNDECEPFKFILFNEQPANLPLVRAEEKVDIDKAVQKLMGWRLPEDFSPDCFVGFDKARAKANDSWPVGTNLLNVEQARTMLKHVLDV